ncbi:uncharacterized protein V1510DRAFT_420832 [Dipodascopsis tothii]|uniref:uncharacterized protein n=1 Tax=Dipodascopsis tothii TaxID=44089 RepID=UPI0034CDC0D9
MDFGPLRETLKVVEKVFKGSVKAKDVLAKASEAPPLAQLAPLIELEVLKLVLAARSLATIAGTTDAEQVQLASARREVARSQDTLIRVLPLVPVAIDRAYAGPEAGPARSVRAVRRTVVDVGLELVGALDKMLAELGSKPVDDDDKLVGHLDSLSLAEASDEQRSEIVKEYVAAALAVGKCKELKRLDTALAPVDGAITAAGAKVVAEVVQLRLAEFRSMVGDAVEELEDFVASEADFTDEPVSDDDEWGMPASALAADELRRRLPLARMWRDKLVQIQALYTALGKTRLAAGPLAECFLGASPAPAKLDAILADASVLAEQIDNLAGMIPEEDFDDGEEVALQKTIMDAVARIVATAASVACADDKYLAWSEKFTVVFAKGVPLAL